MMGKTRVRAHRRRGTKGVRKHSRKTKGGKITAQLVVSSYTYKDCGFQTHTYFLHVKGEGKSKNLMLGQDAKVFSRMLGIDMRDAVRYYSEKAGSKDWDKVKKYVRDDIIRALLGKEQDEPITQGDLRRLLKAEPWETSVE